MAKDTTHISPDTIPAARPTLSAADSTFSPAGPGNAPKPFHSLTDTIFTRAIAPADSAATDTVAAAAVPDWHLGMAPEPRPMQPGNRSGFLILIALMFVVMTFNFRHFSRVLRQYGKEVWTLRRGRENVFDDHPGADTRVLVLLLMQCVACTGILLCAGVCRLDLHSPESMTGELVGAMIGLCAVWYLLQLAAYSVVGYTFATRSGRREWLRGFNSSQALLGLGMVLPAVLAVFYPPLTLAAACAAAVLYLAARILFIIKGFRIFFDNFGSLLYFILYLCTLEIIPVICIYECSLYLVSFVN